MVMKKYFMMAAMAVAAFTASAQKGEFHYTPHVSIGYAYFSHEEYVGFDISLNHSIQGTIGADVEYMLSNSFGLSAGLDYNYIYAKDSDKTPKLSLEATTSFSYLNVPILAQYHLGDGFALKAGLQPMFILAAKGTFSIDGVSLYDKSSTDGFKTMALALPVGISYTFHTPITLDLRCNIPVTTLNSDDDYAKIVSVSLGIGYRF